MLQVNFLRENKERVLEGLGKRGFKQVDLVDQAISLDDDRKKLQFELDQNLSEMNRISKEIGLLMRDGKKDRIETFRSFVSDSEYSLREGKSWNDR